MDLHPSVDRMAVFESTPNLVLSPNIHSSTLTPQVFTRAPAATSCFCPDGRSLPSPQVFASADGAPLALVDDRR
jgi:hypothetical protein